MKLLFCTSCKDIFNLRQTLKKCSCGMSSGIYTDYLHAEVSGPCISIAFDNNTLRTAILKLIDAELTKEELSYETAVKEFGFTAWVRPSDGPSNPNTRKRLKK